MMDVEKEMRLASDKIAADYPHLFERNPDFWFISKLSFIRGVNACIDVNLEFIRKEQDPAGPVNLKINEPA